LLIAATRGTHLSAAIVSNVEASSLNRIGATVAWPLGCNMISGPP